LKSSHDPVVRSSGKEENESEVRKDCIIDAF
jgi:hypothetical protein